MIFSYFKLNKKNICACLKINAMSMKMMLKNNSLYYYQFQKVEKNNVLQLFSKLCDEDFPVPLRDILVKKATVLGSTYEILCEQIFP